MAAMDKMYRPDRDGPKLPMPNKPIIGIPTRPGKPSRPGAPIMKPQPIVSKPIVREPGKVYAGGTPNFDMSTGTIRTPVTSPVNRADNPARVAQPKSSVNAIGGY